MSAVACFNSSEVGAVREIVGSSAPSSYRFCKQQDACRVQVLRGRSNKRIYLYIYIYFFFLLDQSVVQTTFSSLTLQTPVVPAFPTSNLSNLFVCNAMCVSFDLVTIFQYASTMVNQCLHFDVFLPTSTHIFKVSTFQLRHSPFFTWFVLRFTSFS